MYQNIMMFMIHFNFFYLIASFYFIPTKKSFEIFNYQPLSFCSAALALSSITFASNAFLYAAKRRAQSFCFYENAIVQNIDLVFKH
jgi:hypothetical protein